MCKHEQKQCPRCQSPFECKVGDIAQCQCYGLALTEEEKSFLQGRYEDCLCRKCLEELKQRNILFREKFFTGSGR